MLYHLSDRFLNVLLSPRKILQIIWLKLHRIYKLTWERWHCYNMSTSVLWFRLMIHPRSLSFHCSVLYVSFWKNPQLFLCFPLLLLFWMKFHYNLNLVICDIQRFHYFWYLSWILLINAYSCIIFNYSTYRTWSTAEVI
jgi:hypothetical protein